MSTATSVGLRPTPILTIPLISSSLTLFYAIVEPTVFIPFLQAAKEDAPAANRIVRLWWMNYLPSGLVTIFVGGLYAARHLPENSIRRKLCLGGSVFAAGHFAYGYAIAQTIKKVVDKEEVAKGKSMDYVRKWLDIHLWRTLTTDLPALVCFAWVAFGPDE
ncbi:hypothetical protein LTR99_006502 [Exophiala xenobiotica]|uniref:Integral membrane protein n=1 Tax=Vermiconidia calcicola TaxID=1690605 RepID=A0AAV9Q7P0_9PEZI|nr:hypothetical protein LTR72_008298 [Exophiala xenobiotica]KAK5535609.1 hypothetical protein LTR23_008203 [Chaetothyriales sp. CCFEE 6169]KAK5537672.1 hypothetical protein LTR25_004924 [Vermiconidia calcicola]KAK5258639.1 hypothetical protein LTR40_007510 [Exophiala xenobiotica]KAK5267315.1 hypothetical protein LTR96_007348 [Exophiala xenobiotica]